MRFPTKAIALSAAGLCALAGWEGYRSKAYIPVAGDVPTIGFGSTSGVKMGDRITVPEALNRLNSDSQVAVEGVQSCVRVPLSQDEMDAYTSLAYNIGIGAFCRSTLVKKLNNADYAGACAEILKWSKSGGMEVAGLKRRREAEYQQCMKAVDSEAAAGPEGGVAK